MRSVPSAGMHPGLTAALSLILPGLGQVFKGHILSGSFFFLFVPLGYVLLFFPGAILHLICVYHAYAARPRT